MTASLTTAWPRLRLIGGVLVLGVLVWRFGTGPFADAWQVTTWGSVALAVVLTALATLANAWRWRVVSRNLGVPLTTFGSVAAYYRSQFLNAVLPGGVLGDAHRGAQHGRDAGDLGSGLRATGWDRVTGQLVQAGLVVLAVALLATPLHGYTPVALAGLAVGGGGPGGGGPPPPGPGGGGGGPRRPRAPPPRPRGGSPDAAAHWRSSAATCASCSAPPSPGGSSSPRAPPRLRTSLCSRSPSTPSASPCGPAC